VGRSDLTRSVRPLTLPRFRFLIRNTPNGLLPTYLRDKAEVGAPLEFTGPLGSFYLREIRRPSLFLAGGTGLAPFLAMLEMVSHTGSKQPIHLIYGVTNDPDLVLVERLETFAHRLPSFSFACCVADEKSTHPNKGYVTRYIEPGHMHGGMWTLTCAGRHQWSTRCATT